MRYHRLLLLLFVIVSFTYPADAQLYSYETEFLHLIYYDEAHEYLTYHLVRSFENSLGYHRKLFDYTPSEPIVVLFQDFGDYGHGGASTVPWNFISIGIEPFDYVYETMPANERMNWLMHHELVHIVATEKAAERDRKFRSFFRGKVAPEAENPLSMYYSYLTSPRWYAPRWYHEGIAVFLETWMAGGLGRALGGYDEMVFRTMVLEKEYFYDVVGLASEGRTIDFQVGQNSYLYGTRFLTYVANEHGPDKLIEWFDRRPDSKPYFSKQFEHVYGTTLDEEWSRWIEWEHEWQRKNLLLIREYPTTSERAITEKPLGSASRTFHDAEENRIIAAVNYPGKPARIVSIDVGSGEEETLAKVSGPALYYVTSLAWDADTKKVFYTTDNSRGWRDLNEVDLETGKQRLLLKDCRTGDLVVNKSDHSIWGIQHHNGLSSLVRFMPPYEEWERVLTLDYGRDIFDLDISDDGTTISVSLIEINGRQQLVSMKVDDLLEGKSSYNVLHEFPDNSPANFVFSPDGRYLYGTSYYTGASNIFRYDFETGKMEAMSNVYTGYFRPVPISDDEILVYRYTADGLLPVIIPIEVIEDINAVRYLGQQVVENHPEVKEWKAGSPADIKLDEARTGSGEYNPVRSIELASMFPTIEGYRDSVAVGMRFNFADPLGLHSIKIDAGVTVDGDAPDDERFHLTAVWDAGRLESRVQYNTTDFYDLFGPTKSSRKGYAAGVKYGNYLIYERPKTMEYSVSAAFYGGLDTLPDFQNVPTSVEEYSTAYGSLSYKNLKRTIGAIAPERGVEWSLRSRVNYVEGEVLPRIYGTFDVGVPLPIEHSSLWIRTAAGRSFRGETDDPFANFFFGGFGNNWVDYQEAQRYREYYSYPGVEINEVGGTDFAKAMLEWSLPAIRFRKVGFKGLYSNWVRLSLFGSGLVTNISGDEERRELSNAGAQVDFSLVMFSNLESMFSIGYAQAFENGESSDEFMISLKLLR